MRIQTMAARRSLSELRYLTWLALRLLYLRRLATSDEFQLMLQLEHELGIGEVEGVAA